MEEQSPGEHCTPSYLEELRASMQAEGRFAESTLPL